LFVSDLREMFSLLSQAKKGVLESLPRVRFPSPAPIFSMT
jgi:hypothetical protein